MINLFTGANTFEIEQSIKALVAQFDGEVEKVDGEDLAREELPDILNGVTLFSSKRLVIIKNASANKPLWGELVDWLEKEVSNEIIFVEPSPDKRTRTFKWLEKYALVTICKELQPNEAVSWVMQQTVKEQSFHEPLHKGVAEFLIDYAGTDQWRLENELNKLILAEKPITKELIQELVEPMPQATSFELLDAAFRGEPEEFSRLFEIVSKDNDPYMFFGLIAGQVYALALVATAKGKSQAEIAKDCGVHPFILSKVSLLAKRMTLGQINSLVSRLAELDANMKSRPVEPWTQIRSFLQTI